MNIDNKLFLLFQINLLSFSRLKEKSDISTTISYYIENETLKVCSGITGSIVVIGGMKKFISKDKNSLKYQEKFINKHQESNSGGVKQLNPDITKELDSDVTKKSESEEQESDSEEPSDTEVNISYTFRQDPLIEDLQNDINPQGPFINTKKSTEKLTIEYENNNYLPISSYKNKQFINTQHEESVNNLLKTSEDQKEDTQNIDASYDNESEYVSIKYYDIDNSQDTEFYIIPYRSQFNNSQEGSQENSLITKELINISIISGGEEEPYNDYLKEILNGLQGENHNNNLVPYKPNDEYSKLIEENNTLLIFFTNEDPNMDDKREEILKNLKKKYGFNYKVFYQEEFYYSDTNLQIINKELSDFKKSIDRIINNIDQKLSLHCDFVFQDKKQEIKYNIISDIFKEKTLKLSTELIESVKNKEYNTLKELNKEFTTLFENIENFEKNLEENFNLLEKFHGSLDQKNLTVEKHKELLEKIHKLMPLKESKLFFWDETTSLDIESNLPNINKALEENIEEIEKIQEKLKLKIPEEFHISHSIIIKNKYSKINIKIKNIHDLLKNNLILFLYNRGVIEKNIQEILNFKKSVDYEYIKNLEENFNLLEKFHGSLDQKNLTVEKHKELLEKIHKLMPLKESKLFFWGETTSLDIESNLPNINKTLKNNIEEIYTILIKNIIMTISNKLLLNSNIDSELKKLQELNNTLTKNYEKQIFKNEQIIKIIQNTNLTNEQKLEIINLLNTYKYYNDNQFMKNEVVINFMKALNANKDIPQLIDKLKYNLSIMNYWTGSYQTY